MNTINCWSSGQVAILVEEGRADWLSLSSGEQEKYFYDCGTYGFVEELCDKLNIPMTEDEIQFETVHELIIYGRDTEIPPDVDTYDYTVHLNVKSTRPLSAIDIQVVLTKMAMYAISDEPVELEYVYHEQV